MPKYNLMDNLDSDENEKPVPPKEAPKKADKAAEEETVDETQLGDFLSEDINLSEPEIKINGEAAQSDDTVSDFMPPEPPKTPEPVTEPVMQPFDLGSDYMDEKQPGMNFKPLLYGVGILAILALIWFAVDTFILSDTGNDEPVVTQESPEEKLQRERAEQKLRFLQGVVSESRHKMSHLAALVDLNPSNLTYSSLLLYGNTLNFEVFAAKRDELGRFNLALKGSPMLKNYNIETSQNRPGSRGGVFALYSMEISPGGGTTTGDFTPVTANADSWTANTAAQFGLKIQSQRQISSRTENLFSVTRNEIVFQGPQSDCTNLIKQLAVQNANINIHKLTFLPKNQRDMSKKDYELRMTLDFYL